jgi:hypothetical protein
VKGLAWFHIAKCSVRGGKSHMPQAQIDVRFERNCDECGD